MPRRGWLRILGMFRLADRGRTRVLLHALVVAGAVSSPLNIHARDLPLRDGVYFFNHRFAEHPSMQSIDLEGTIKGNQIRLINHHRWRVFPTGVVEEGELFWHAKARQWVIVSAEEDKYADEVGGCSNGPPVIDLERMIYWTC